MSRNGENSPNNINLYGNPNVSTTHSVKPTTINSQLVSEASGTPKVKPTTINSQLASEASGTPKVKPTTINSQLASEASAIPKGTVLGDHYEIVELLNNSTGEADLYICKYLGNKYVAKIYRRQHAAKSEVIKAWKSIDSDYVAKLYETGVYDGLPFEIIPYYKNGSLQGKIFSLSELKKTIIPSINEALKVLHEKNIIHKDLKPSNIMLKDNGRDIAIIDFGISSVTTDGNSVVLTRTGMTPEYSAPETFQGLFLAESDYYSFGITLFELYCGHTPYKDLSADEIARFTAVQRIPIPETMPEKLGDLISALTYHDITNRDNLNNPNRRWTYAEVDDWCKGRTHILPSQGGGAAATDIPPYTFSGRVYTDIPSLTAALARNWDEGKQHLYRSLLSDYFRKFNQDFANACMNAEDTFSKNQSLEDVIFHELIYRICPELSAFYWRGRVYGSLSELGNEMLERLWGDDLSQAADWDCIINNKLPSRHLARRAPESGGLVSAVSALEAAHSLMRNNPRDTKLNYYKLAYMLSGNKLFCIDGMEHGSLSQLTGYMESLLKQSYAKFESFCHRLIDRSDILDAQLEAWLVALGKQEELERWREKLQPSIT